MVDVAVAAQLQQWTFEKPSLATRPERSSSGSSTSSPKLCDDVSDTLRIDTAAVPQSLPASRKESIMMDRYLSSEEDLSAVDDGPESDIDYEDVVIHDLAKECKARTMSISRWDKGRSCDMAVMVSYAFAGRPKVVDLVDCRSPTTERPIVQQRSASLANLPVAAISKLRKAEQAQRLSMNVIPSRGMASPPLTRPVSPSIEAESRRPSTSHGAITKKSSTLHLTGSASTTSSFQTAASSRSTSPAYSEAPRRPSTSAEPSASARSSVYVASTSRLDLTRRQTAQPSYRQSQFAPLTPSSPAMSFLSSDPYETSTTNAASPIIKKPAAHTRLRSLSMKLSLARIAIAPSKKPYDSRLNGKMVSTPMTPMTPQTAPIEGSSSFSSPNKLRRASTILRPKSRAAEPARGPSPEMAPPVPSVNVSASASANMQKRMTRMVARGADEREPVLVLPPCPDTPEDDPMAGIKTKRLRKRKSLMDLL
ncbi:Nn.00g081000.m01.CDS01 [Neocucurbitaria sp. VM-36]